MSIIQQISFVAFSMPVTLLHIVDAVVNKTGMVPALLKLNNYLVRETDTTLVIYY